MFTTTSRYGLTCIMLLIAFNIRQAEATDSTGNKFRHLPIQWCALAGSPTAVSPGTVDPDNPGADTTTVLWRRHERVSDRIYLRLAASNAANDVVPVTFRSADTMETSLKVRTFPIINGPNANGDFNIDPNNRQATMALVQACNQAWGPSAPGIPVINVNHLSYNGNSIGGEGYWGFATGSGDIGQHSTWSVANNFVFIADRKYSANGDQDANLLAHELGHSLNMLHTQMNDSMCPHMIVTNPNLMSLAIVCDTEPPRSLSTLIQDGAGDTLSSIGCPAPACTGFPRTINQIDWHQQEA